MTYEQWCEKNHLTATDQMRWAWQASARVQMERDCRIIQSDVEKDFPKQWELYMSDSNTADSDTSLEWLLSACVRESFEREAGRGDAS